MHKRRVEASVEAHALKCLSSRLKWLSTGAEVIGSNYGKVMLKKYRSSCPRLFGYFHIKTSVSFSYCGVKNINTTLAIGLVVVLSSTFCLGN